MRLKDDILEEDPKEIEYLHSVYIHTHRSDSIIEVGWSEPQLVRCMAELPVAM